MLFLKTLVKLVNDSTFIEHLLCQLCALEEWEEASENKDAVSTSGSSQTTCTITLHLSNYPATDLVPGL